MTVRAPARRWSSACPAGQGVSYGHQYVTDAGHDRSALVPVGYADGIPRNATNVGPGLVGGRAARVAGRVCMDQFVVDLGPRRSTARAGRRGRALRRAARRRADRAGLGRGDRHHRLRDRHPDRRPGAPASTSEERRVSAAPQALHRARASASPPPASAAAAGVAADRLSARRGTATRRWTAPTPTTSRADEELRRPRRRRRAAARRDRRARAGAGPPAPGDRRSPTVVFTHGYRLSLRAAGSSSGGR